MAKLEDQVTPVELLNIIRGGQTIEDVRKQYRTNPQELAKMLLPMYRGGDLTMEEFNDFFRGVPLKPKEPSRENRQEMSVRPEDEPPSQILRSLSEGIERKPKEEPKKPPSLVPEEKTPRTSLSEPTLAAVESAIVEDVGPEDLIEDGDLEDEFLEEPDIEMEGELQPEPPPKEPAAEPPKKIEPQPEKKIVAMPAREAPVVQRPAEQQERPAEPSAEAPSVQASLDAIVGKLSSMEALLMRIERHLRKNQ